MRRLSALLMLMAPVGCATAYALAAALGASSASASTPAPAGGCSPVVTGYSTFQRGPEPAFTLRGRCFGDAQPITGGNSSYFGVAVFPSGTSRSELEKAVAGSVDAEFQRWSACSDVAAPPMYGPTVVTCDITNWAPTSITLRRLTGGYSSKSSTFAENWVLTSGEQLVVQVWNATTGKGPATVYLTAGAPGRNVTIANSALSSIASSLPTPAHAFGSVKSDIIDALITIALALFITFPANLFNSTLQENYADMVAWWRKWDAYLFPAGLRRASRNGYRKIKDFVLAKLRLSGGSSHKKLERQESAFGLVLVVGALLGAMLDPQFGFNFRTVLSFISILVAMFAGVVIGGLVTGGYHKARVHQKVPFRFEALPLGLGVAVFCVVISRATGFQPGYLYGIVAGVAFNRDLRNEEKGHVVALQSWVKMALAILAWVAWAALTHDAAKPGSFFGVVLLDDFLASLFVSAMVGQVISLLPLRFMPGHELRQWRKWAWAITFLVTLFVVVQVMLRPHSTSSGPSHAPLVLTIMLFALFGAGSVLFRDHFARKKRRLAAALTPVATAAVEMSASQGAISQGPISQGAISQAVISRAPIDQAAEGPAPERP